MWVIPTEICKRCRDHCRPECQELAQRAFGVFGIKSSRVIPVAKPFAVVVRTSTQGEDQRAQDDSNHDHHFERGQPEFHFTKELDAEVVDPDDSHHEDGDPHAGVDIVGRCARPVGNYQRGGS